MKDKYMTYDEFAKCMEILTTEYLYREELYRLGMIEILGRLNSFDLALALIEYIFDDERGGISEAMYEDNELLRTEFSLKEIYRILTERGEELGTA